MRAPRIAVAIGAVAGTAGVAGAGLYGLERVVLRLAERRPDPTGGAGLRYPEAERVDVEVDDGARIASFVSGPPAGPTVVFSHGLSMSHEAWSLVAPRLLASGYRVVAFDHRGHGVSTVGTEGYGPRRLAADLAAVLEALDVHDAVLVGHSMGGMTAMALLLDQPAAARIARAVLVATLARVTRPDRVRLLAMFGTSRVRRLEQHARHGPAAQRLGSFGRAPSAAIIEAARQLAITCPLPVRDGASRGMVGFDVTARLPDIAVPTTVVCGTLDIVTPMRANRAIARSIPGAAFVPVPGAGHLVVLEAPELLHDVIVGHDG